MSPKDAALAKQVDRQIWSMLVSSEGFAVQPLNQPGIKTHVSGSIIDFVFQDGSVAGFAPWRG